MEDKRLRELESEIRWLNRRGWYLTFAYLGVCAAVVGVCIWL